jgi:pimeloyl-ACP methyl ester carboxylesterase
MILEASAAALAAGIAALSYNSDRYSRTAAARWPAQGRFIEAEGARLHVREDGPADAPRLLLVHGASANLRELWGPLAPHLLNDHRVIAYDRPGMGHSERPKRAAETLTVQARCAARVLEQTGAGPALIVGHSLGAAVSLRLALDFPHLVRGLVLIAPASHPYPGDNAWWAKLSSAPIVGDLFCHLVIPALGPPMSVASVGNNFWPQPTPPNYFEEAGVGLIFRPRAFRASAQDVVATNREFAAQAPRYPDLFQPAVVVTAEKDKVLSPKRHARALAADLPAAELVIAPDTGHMPHRLRTDLVLTAIRRVNAMAGGALAG